MPLLPSFKSQSTDLHSKSIDWFLYESNTGTQWVNHYESLFQRAWKDSLKRVLEAYSETCQTLKGSAFSIFAKSSILDICQGFEYASVLWNKKNFDHFVLNLIARFGSIFHVTLKCPHCKAWSYSTPFSWVSKNDYVHAFVCWDDLYFQGTARWVQKMSISSIFLWYQFTRVTGMLRNGHGNTNLLRLLDSFGTISPIKFTFLNNCDTTLICWPLASRYDSGTPVTRAISM